jgi:glucose/arabinose dehydrogenase
MVNRIRLVLVLVAAGLLTGCYYRPLIVPVGQRRGIDRAIVETPTGFELQPYIRFLTDPAAFAFDNNGNLIVAEGTTLDSKVRIFGFRPNGSRFDIYPIQPIHLIQTFSLYGPVGGLVVDQNKIYVSHHDSKGRGVITAFDYDGHHKTVVANLPAQGEYGVTDMAIGPNGKIYFGIGSATNSGVVGLDDWEIGWIRHHPKFCDLPDADLKLLGYRFDTPNPIAGLFGPGETAVTAPFQPFGTGNRLRIPKAAEPTGAIYSVNPMGGDLDVVAHGIRYPRGLAFNEYGRLYITDEGMQLRGTRPVKDDPDSLLWVLKGTWYGFPDFSADLRPITELSPPPEQMLIKTGYPELSNLIDHEASGLFRPDRSTLVRGVFRPLSGAAKLDFVRSSGPFAQFRGSAIVALSGDRAPFATSGHKLLGPIGYKIVRVDVDSRQVHDFVHNTENRPASKIHGHPEALERPVDVKFGPDGALYILDLGIAQYKSGSPNIHSGTGEIFRLASTKSHAQ